MKTDYVLRRRALLGISALFCSTLLLFGCQDSADPVGPDVASDADSPASLSKHNPNHNPPGGGGPGPDAPPAATLSLTVGMLAEAFEVKVTEKKKNRTIQASNNTNDNFEKPTIQMAFVDTHDPANNVVGCVGKASHNGQTPAPVRVEDGGDGTFEDLLVQLTATVVPTDNVYPTVVMHVTRDNLGDTGGHFLVVNYEDTKTNLGTIGIWFGQFAPVTVTQDPADPDVFEFFGELNVNSDGGRISCPKQKVVLTLDRNPSS